MALVSDVASGIHVSHVISTLVTEERILYLFNNLLLVLCWEMGTKHSCACGNTKHKIVSYDCLLNENKKETFYKQKDLFSKISAL